MFIRFSSAPRAQKSFEFLHFRQVTLKFVCPWHFPLAQVFKFPKHQIENLKPFTGVLADYNGLFPDVTQLLAPCFSIRSYCYAAPLFQSYDPLFRLSVYCLLTQYCQLLREARAPLVCSLLRVEYYACYFLNYAPIILIFIAKPLNQCFQ